MSKIVASAPAKLILHGEHAVLYGKAAVALSIGLRTKTEADLHFGEKKFKIALNNLEISVEWELDTLHDLTEEMLTVEDDDEVIPLTDKCQQHLMNIILSTGQTDNVTQQALLSALFLYVGICSKYRRALNPLLITVTSELPLGAGLGSSASYTVCLAAIFLAVCEKVPLDQPLSDTELSLISKWAFQAEKIHHGQPSGIDTSICTYGGALLFKKGKICQTLNATPPIKILLINTKISRNTKAVVARLRDLYKKHKGTLDHIMCAIDSISELSWQMLQECKNYNNQNITELKELIIMNHHLLNVLEVGHPQLDAIYEVARQHNFGAKLTGAGCGGCAFVLLSTREGANQEEKENRNMLFQVLTSKGFECFETVIGCQGVKFH